MSEQVIPERPNFRTCKHGNAACLCAECEQVIPERKGWEYICGAPCKRGANGELICKRPVKNPGDRCPWHQDRKMEEPVIPENSLISIGLNQTVEDVLEPFLVLSDDRGRLAAYALTLKSELSIAKAKVAEQEDTISELKSELEESWSERKYNFEQFKAANEAQAATIASLAEALARIGKVRTWVLAWRIAREALKDCGKWPDASLGKQVQQ